MSDEPPNMDSVGPDRVDTVFARNFAGRDQVIPASFSELERRAMDSVSDDVANFISTGAGQESTKNANREAFERWRIHPRVLRGGDTRDLGVEVLGLDLPTPVCLAPIGGIGTVHDEGELAVARAAARLDLPMALSSFSSYSLEAVADAHGDGPRFFQLYLSTEDDVTERLVERAEAAGFDAIILTVDTPIRGWRPNEIDSGFSVFNRAATGFGSYFNEPAFLEKLDPLTRLAAKVPYARRAVSLLRYFGPTRTFVQNRGKQAEHIAHKSPLTWEDVAKVGAMTDLPVVLKGILHTDDAERAVEEGADGVIVSNHGGGHIDGAIGALEALPDVVDAVGDDVDVLFDSGIRTGTDVLKALALGADAVLLGRPYLYALAVAGEEGVYEEVMNILAELDITMLNAGFPRVDDLNRDVLVDRRC